MAIRTILSVVSSEQGDRDAVNAATLAEEIGAHLVVLVLDLAPAPPVGEFGLVAPDVWMTERQSSLEQVQARVEHLKDRLARSAVRVDVESDYLDQGSADDVIGRRGRYADLTVLGAGLRTSVSLYRKATEGAIFWSGRPLLVLPENGRHTLKPRRVMVAWDHRPEAARAANAALPLLAQADLVRLVLVDPVRDEGRHGAEPGADAAAWLARHGVKVEVDRLASEGMTVEWILDRHARDCAADLLVMGAFGHSRLRERIFGGVTTSMLENPSLPVLMAR